ncbi:MAG: aspartate dehydrogenase [Pseudomonadota bacterium]|nr:aspartate dehydrogenase [Pseudomonadota bacterium]
MNVLLIGYGAIAQEVLKHIGPDGDARITAILVRTGRVEEVRAAVSDRGIEVVSSFDDLTVSPKLVAECAGHAGVREYGADALRRGMDFLVISIGVLADTALYEELLAAAKEGGAKLVLAAGAVAGADALAAARVGGLSKVTYTSRKPPGAWKGTPAEEVCDLDALETETALYEGGADEAATRYPQNANVAATIALAGAGFGDTKVRLVADPEAGGNIHQVHAEGMFGAVDIEIRGKPLPDNPKTSTLAAHSVVAEIRRRAAPVEIGG